MPNTENNELRCHANEIILMLHKQKELGQIQLLYMACALSIKDLDRAMWRRMLKDAMPELEGGAARSVAEQPSNNPSPEQFGAAPGWASALTRAATALEHRINMTETVMIPQAEERRNGGVAAVLREGLTNDRNALATLQTLLRSPNDEICKHGGPEASAAREP